MGRHHFLQVAAMVHFREIGCFGLSRQPLHRRFLGSFGLCCQKTEGTQFSDTLAVPATLSLSEALTFAEAALRDAGDDEATVSAPYLVAMAALGETGSNAVANLRQRLRAEETEEKSRLSSTKTSQSTPSSSSSSSSPPPPHLPPPLPSTPGMRLVNSNSSVGNAFGGKQGSAVVDTVAAAAEAGGERAQRPGFSIGPAVADALSNLLVRRAAREPIQYILGEWDFHELEGILVGAPVLVPRPETEELVEMVLSAVKEAVSRRAESREPPYELRVLDVGAGTGAIGLALLKALASLTTRDTTTTTSLSSKAQPLFSALHVVAVEPSLPALTLTHANAKKFLVGDGDNGIVGHVAGDNGAGGGDHHEGTATTNGGKGRRRRRRQVFRYIPQGLSSSSSSCFTYECFHGTLKEFVSAREEEEGAAAAAKTETGDGDAEATTGLQSSAFDPFLSLFDVLVSNPPYIPSADMAGLMPDVRLFEDVGALCGGADGLDVVREIFAVAPTLLVPTATAATTSIGGTRRGERNKEGLFYGLEDLGNTWLEVDSSHPSLIQAWLQPPPQTPSSSAASLSSAPLSAPSSVSAPVVASLPHSPPPNALSSLGPPPPGVRWVFSHDDFGGLPRFCVLGTKATTPPLLK